jgi:hypothetical protein
LRADVLARDQEMLVKSHVRSLSLAVEQFGSDARHRFGSLDPRDITLPLKKRCPATTAV